MGDTGYVNAYSDNTVHEDAAMRFESNIEKNTVISNALEGYQLEVNHREGLKVHLIVLSKCSDVF